MAALACALDIKTAAAVIRVPLDPAAENARIDALTFSSNLEKHVVKRLSALIDQWSVFRSLDEIPRAPADTIRTNAHDSRCCFEEGSKLLPFRLAFLRVGN